jgi:hypothetical protein
MKHHKISLPPAEQECLCGQQHIKEQCYIEHKDKGWIEVIGSICVEKFWSGFVCMNCNKIYVRNYRVSKDRERTDFFCDTCFNKLREQERKKKIQEQERNETINIDPDTTLVGFGKYENKSYKWVLEHDQNYCFWIYNKKDIMGYKATKFKKWMKYTCFVENQF